MTSDEREQALSSFAEARAAKCRECGEPFRAPKVVYGMPTFATLLRAASDDDIVFGGCIPGAVAPARCGCPVAR